MSLFVISDLHFSSVSDHPMDIFGSRWHGYTEKICQKWRAAVTEEDTVVIPGDISWAMHLNEAKEDFLLLDALPGKKYLGKGNHDFWWETASKMNRFWEENGISTFSILFNNAHLTDDFIICGTRGWFVEEDQQITVGEVDYAKIVNREVMRLKMSLDAAKGLQQGEHAHKEILVFLHFPPVWNGFSCPEILEVLKAYGIKRCYHGHIHGTYNVPRTQIVDGVELCLISSDFLDFCPLRILPLTQKD